MSDRTVLVRSSWWIATLGSGASHGIWVTPAGSIMFDGAGTPAGADRIGFIRGDEGSWDNISPDGEQILRNAISFALVPEPSTTTLLGLLGFLVMGRRRRR